MSKTMLERTAVKFYWLDMVVKPEMLCYGPDFVFMKFWHALACFVMLRHLLSSKERPQGTFPSLSNRNTIQR